MTQEELKEQAINYIDYNITEHDKKLEIVADILEELSNDFYENGYVHESNVLTTCLLKIEDILKNN